MPETKNVVKKELLMTDTIYINPYRLRSYRKNANNYIDYRDKNNVMVGYLTLNPKVN